MTADPDRRADAPTLSVVLVVTSDAATGRCNADGLAAALVALAGQSGPPRMELIVPFHDAIDGIDGLQPRFPHVRWLECRDLHHRRPGGGRDHHDEMRARGAASAQGEIVAFLEDHVRAEPEWAHQVVAAHAAACDVVGGAIDNAVDSPLHWAVYFCDLGRYQNPLPRGPSTYASCVNISYKRRTLDTVRDVWKDRFAETPVNDAILSRGGAILLEPAVVVRQHRDDVPLRQACREFFVWGRSFAANRVASASLVRRALLAAGSALLPIVMLLRQARIAIARRRNTAAFLRALPYSLLLNAAWSLGEFTGYLRGHDHSPSTMASAAGLAVSRPSRHGDGPG